ncbi:MAG: epoxide hydrolase [Thermomicrobiales bacterium]|nr:epoxide hydrolase [Thermomicrobiales bacterium]
MTATPRTSADIRPFHLTIPEAELTDLRDRLARTRWPEPAPDLDWSYGPPVDYLRGLADYWRTGYDWRAAEAEINSYPQFVTTIDGHDIHFIHMRSPEPNATPLLLTHGWAGSILEFLRLIGPLTDPRAHGGDPADAFHVVIPSPPGFGLSGPTREAGWSVPRVARAFAELMHRLGYEYYVAHGGDFGAMVTRELGLVDEAHVAAVHVTLLPAASVSGNYAVAAEADPAVPAEQRSLEAAQRYDFGLSGYAAVQTTRPEMIGFGLNDSPVFLLAWLLDIFKNWTDTEGLPEEAVDRDTLLTNAMLYWLTGTAASSVRYYKDGSETWGEPEAPLAVPMAVAVSPRDNFIPIRRIAERSNTIVRWTEFEEGGHFPGLEQPELLVADLRDAFRDFRAG